MKRITFKLEHKEAVETGVKRFTSRWGDVITPGAKFKIGDICVAVCSQVVDGKQRPGFLVPAALGFAKVKIVKVTSQKWPAFTDADANQCGVSRDWYLAHGAPAIPDLHYINTYEFEVVK